MSSLRSDTLTMRVTGVRITVFCSAIVIDVIVHCHTAGALFESNGRKQLSLSSCGWVLILSGSSITLVLDLARQFERVSFSVVWAWATHVDFTRKILWVLRGYFEHQRRVQFEECVVAPLQTITAVLLRSKWSCLLLRVVLQESDLVKVCPPL